MQQSPSSAADSRSPSQALLMKPGGSSPHSQQPANGPYPEPAESISYPPNLFP
jgi:hypothetical protein